MLTQFNHIPFMLALVGIPPHVAVAFVDINEGIGAGVTAGKGVLSDFDGVHVLNEMWDGSRVVVIGHGDDLECRARYVIRCCMWPGESAGGCCWQRQRANVTILCDCEALEFDDMHQRTQPINIQYDTMNYLHLS